MMHVDFLRENLFRREKRAGHTNAHTSRMLDGCQRRRRIDIFACRRNEFIQGQLHISYKSQENNSVCSPVARMSYTTRRLDAVGQISRSNYELDGRLVLAIPHAL